MYDPDIAAKIRSGGWMVTAGILLIVAGIFGACMGVASNRSSRYDSYDSYDDRGASDSFEAGQNPFMLLALAGGIALITVGQVKKSNARREGEDRFRAENFTVTKVVPDPDVGGGPFRGALKEVQELDPVIAAVEAAQRVRDHAKGTSNLILGLVLTIGTIVAVMWSITSAPPHDLLSRFTTAFGLGVFPFGFGLFFSIRGLILRSK